MRFTIAPISLLIFGCSSDPSAPTIEPSGGQASVASGGVSASGGLAAGGQGVSGGGSSAQGGSSTQGGNSAQGGSSIGAGGNSGTAAGGAAGGDNGSGGAGVFIDPCIQAGTCPEGVWLQHELPGFDYVNDRVETVLVDPVRPSDFWALVHNGTGEQVMKVYASTDFGNTWVDRNTTSGIKGKPWGASIDPNPTRDPGTIPTLWTPAGSGNGAWKSTDAGFTWERSAGCDAAFGPHNPFGDNLTDVYHVQVLPDDPPNHLLATYHYYFKETYDEDGRGGFGESWDGGETWVIHPPPVGIGSSHYVIPIGATTWAVISQDAGGTTGIWRTTTAGRVGGTEGEKFRDGTISTSAWQKVDTLEHLHGSHQNVVLADGTILATGYTNGARSTDAGATWTHFTNGAWAGDHQYEGSLMSNIAVTDKFIYTDYLYAANLARAPRDNPIGAENWDVEYCETPEGMVEGGSPFGMATAKDTENGKWIIVASANHDGIWKYVEP